MWHWSRPLVLIWMSVLGWGCPSTEGPGACEELDGEAADLCWAQQAESLLMDDPTGALSSAGRISDPQLHDITMLMIQRTLKGPQARVDNCKKIRDEQAQNRCLTYEVRPHLWTKLADEGAAEPGGQPTTMVNSPACEHLPSQLADACELQRVISHSPAADGATSTSVLDKEQCLSIVDPNVRAKCQMEVATVLAQHKGLDVGVAACQEMDVAVFRSECLLRVRATHPEAPLERQVEVCSLAGNLETPCHGMIIISAGAYLLNTHGRKPMVEALSSLDEAVSSSADLLAGLTSASQAARFYREVWYRIFYRVVYVQQKPKLTTSEQFMRIAAIMSALDPDDQRYPLLRANFLRFYASRRCRSPTKKQATQGGYTLPQECGGVLQLTDRFAQNLARAEASGRLAALQEAPLYGRALDHSDWWAVYRSDAGMVPASLVRDCNMTVPELDAFIATVAMTPGDWVDVADSFRQALHSEYVSVREYAVVRLIKRLFVEWPYLPERETTAATLREWKHQYNKPTQLILQHILDAMEQDTLVPRSETDRKKLHAAEHRVRERIRNDAELSHLYSVTGGAPSTGCAEPQWPVAGGNGADAVGQRSAQ